MAARANTTVIYIVEQVGGGFLIWAFAPHAREFCVSQGYPLAHGGNAFLCDLAIETLESRAKVSGIGPVEKLPAVTEEDTRRALRNPGTCDRSTALAALLTLKARHQAAIHDFHRLAYRLRRSLKRKSGEKFIVSFYKYALGVSKRQAQYSISIGEMLDKLDEPEGAQLCAYGNSYLRELASMGDTGILLISKKEFPKNYLEAKACAVAYREGAIPSDTSDPEVVVMAAKDARSRAALTKDSNSPSAKKKAGENYDGTVAATAPIYPQLRVRFKELKKLNAETKGFLESSDWSSSLSRHGTKEIRRTDEQISQLQNYRKTWSNAKKDA